MPRRIFFLLFFLLFRSSVDGQSVYDNETRIIFDLGQTSTNESIKDLIAVCDGFKFTIAKNELSGNVEIEYKNQNLAFQTAVKEWPGYLRSNPRRIITLFIETNIPWEQVRLKLEESGLLDFVASKTADGSLPSYTKLLGARKQLIIFSLNEQKSIYNWVFPYWEHGFQLKQSINVPTLFNDLENGDYKSNLLLIEVFSSSELFKNFQKKHASSGWSVWQFFLNYLINTWQQNGKKVSFFVTDPASGLTRKSIEGMNNFKAISGKVQHNLLPLDYVIWGEEEKQKFTSGEFNFPVFPNREIELTPRSPGFEFSPASIRIIGTNTQDSIYFYANPVNIKKQLQLYLPFKKNSKNYNSGEDGINHGVVFRSDIQRGPVATFGPKKWVGLPPANELGIVQSDFTFSVWLKLDSVNSEQSIIGTYTQDLRGSIHLSLRNSIPYFGFFGNDHLGKNHLETGRWYHLVWRYMKFSGEQAIYVNGKPDSRSNNHPAYDGTDSLYIGRTTLVGGRYFNGQMSDFVLWNRALSETEILLLAKDLAPIDSPVPVSYWYWGAAFLIILLVVAAMFLFKRKTNAYPAMDFPGPIAGVEKPEHLKVPPAPEPEKTAPTVLEGLVTKTEVKPAETIVAEAIVITPPAKVQIQVFGKFRLMDTLGMNRITALSPKIRELLLVLLLYSQKYEEGISTEELTIVLWNGFDSKKATNNRNVSIHKLRMTLKEMTGVELVFENNFWKINLDNDRVHFDYPLCFAYLKKLDNPVNHTPAILAAFYAVISKGKLLPEDQYSWLDTFKERLDTEIIEGINFIVEKNQENFSKEELINWIDLLMLFDPINEDMIEMVMKILTDNKLARHYYNKFSHEYKLYYGEKFSASFSELFD